MKILIPSIYHPFLGGITVHVENLIKNLSKLDEFEFHILNYSSNSKKYSFDNVFVHDVPYFKYLRGPSYILNGYKVGGEIITNEKIDLIHSHYAAPQGFLGSLLGKKFNISTVLTLHGSDVLSQSKSAFGKYFFNYAVSNSKKIICVSESLKNQLKSKNDLNSPYLKSEVIYNGFDENLFNPSNIDEDYGLFVGSLVKQKGLFYFLEAIKDVDFNFKIVGSGPLKYNILKYIKSKNIDNVEVLGHKSQIDVSNYVKNCSFLVLPSLSEGLGMTLIEAMASKKAVIGTSVGGIPELITHSNGYLVPPKDVNSLKTKIKILVENKPLRKSFGESGLEFSKKFSWDVSSKKTFEVYKNLLEK
ncbi:glycosyl transferase group 1 [Methanococcus vannielii SB]|uniref:Glycosyl transferase group 1 n=1 Tax=Methanococcus vannielii (strain ATCC 35089 / DSM 1224 / JCM 13029 / OCM 148 / SB) TaxID=406327 RepID=A6UR80_METVS|nr:glycosyltransferase family 4 protein [Methanococcus vannielii]ABR55002.1 glycosyl transferase group 1 [Methanococcus vannielii SB]